MQREKDVSHLTEDRYKGRIVEVGEFEKEGKRFQRATLEFVNHKVRVIYFDGKDEIIRRLPLLPSRYLIFISYTARMGRELGGEENYEFSNGEILRYNDKLLEKLLQKLTEKKERKVKEVEMIVESESDDSLTRII